MRSTALKMVLLAGFAGLSGCQCCALTEHYACLIDWISDHERAEEISYHPGWDLNRIGRPDWCTCRVNRLLCPCACARLRPPPCGYIVCRETGVLKQHPHGPESAPQEEVPDQMPLEDQTPPDDQTIEDAPLPPALQEGEVPRIPDEERLERDLQLP